VENSPSTQGINGHYAKENCLRFEVKVIYFIANLEKFYQNPIWLGETQIKKNYNIFLEKRNMIHYLTPDTNKNGDDMVSTWITSPEGRVEGQITS